MEIISIRLFFVKIKSADEPPICFDFNPPSCATLNLLIDPVSALAVTAETGENEKGLNYMTKVHFMSPEGARLLFDVDGVHLDGLGDEPASDPHPITGHQVRFQLREKGPVGQDVRKGLELVVAGLKGRYVKLKK